MKINYVDKKLTIDGKSRGAAQHVEERNGFRLVLRGDIGRMVDHDYECPVHGRFTLSVPSDAVPDAVECQRQPPAGVLNFVERNLETGSYEPIRCKASSPWRAPRVAQGYAAGEVTC